MPRNSAGDPTDLDDSPVVMRHGYDLLNRRYKTCAGDGPELLDDEPWEPGCTWTAFDKAGRITVQVDERGYATVREYDTANRPVRTCGPAGPYPETTDFAALDCDDIGPDVETRYYPDGRVLATKAEGLSWQVPHYDDAGRRIAECRQIADPATGTPLDDPRDSSNITGVTCRLFELDALGRVTAEVDENGRRTQYSLDATGRLVSVTDARNKVTRYGFDGLGRMTSQTDALDRVTMYEFDVMGRRTARVLPMLQRETFAHALTGELSRRVDFAGRATSHAHDEETGRLASTDLPRVPGTTDAARS